MTEIKLDLDPGLYARFSKHCIAQGLVPEDVVRQYFEWIAREPEKATVWLQNALEEERRQAWLLSTMPRIPLDTSKDTRFNATLEFLQGWDGPVCLECGGDKLVTMPAHYYEKHYGSLPVECPDSGHPVGQEE